MNIKRLLRTNRRKTYLGAIITATIVLFYNSFPEQYYDFQVRLPRGIDISAYVPLQPDFDEDFPTVQSETPKIPHILHQTFSGSCVYERDANYMLSFIENNKSWKYYFWTDKTARTLMEDKYPLVFDIYESVFRGIKRSDILRYVILYEFGGVYADTDVENLRPLHRVTYKYSCVIPSEPLEHSALLHDTPYIINNGIMLCSPKHPFFKQVLENILYTYNSINVLKATGPIFLTKQFNIYYDLTSNIAQLDFHMKIIKNAVTTGSLIYNDTDNRAVHVPNSYYFTANIDAERQSSKFISLCKNFWTLSNLQRRACINLQGKGMIRKNPNFAYTVHHWHHSYHLYGLKDFFLNCVEVKQIIPNAHFYEK